MNKKIVRTKPRIAKSKKDVKGTDEVEASMKKSHEAYLEMIKQSSNPEIQKGHQQNRWRFSQKMWYKVMAELTQTERIVYLCYCACADFDTGEAILSARNQGPLMKMEPRTFCKARENLIKKGFLEKTKKDIHCDYYKILKIISE